MSIKRTLLTVGAAGTIGLLVAGGAVMAHNTTTGNNTLVEKIATKFNVSKDEVQKVFDEDKEVRHAEMEKKYEERLAQAVKDGKLTTEQKDKILAKHKEMKVQMKAMHADVKDKTEHKAAMKKHHEEMQAWLKANNIPEEYMRFVIKADGPGKASHGGGMRMHFESKQ